METIINTRTKYCLRKLKEGNKVKLPFQNDTSLKTTDETGMKESRNLFKNYSPDNFWIKMLFLISGVAVTALLSFALSIPNSNELTILVMALCIPSLLIAVFVWVYLIFNRNILSKIWMKTSRVITLLSTIFTITSSGLFTYYFVQNVNPLISFINPYISLFFNGNATSNYGVIFQIISLYPTLMGICGIVLGVISLFSLFIIWKFLIHNFVNLSLKFYNSMDKIEKIYLYVMFVISVISISIIYTLTNAFYQPIDINGVFHSFDVIFCMDTGDILNQGIYTNIAASSNSSHQFLFGVFALPFGIVAFLISKILFFIPHSFYIVISVIQILLLCIIGLLLSRLLSLNKIQKAVFLPTYTLTFGYLIFSLSLEQYVFVTFWLILFIYLSVINSKKADLAFIAASGSLISSAITFPLLSNKLDIKKYLSTAAKLICLAIVSGKLFSMLYLIPHLISITQRWSGDVTIVDKLMQYLNFSSSCLFFDGGVVGLSFRNLPVTSINITGLIVICIAIIGFIVSHKDKFARICFGWFVFSIVFFGIIGFGTGSNELPLYTLYVGWAYLSLIYFAVKGLFKSHNKIQIAIFVLLLIALIIVNIPGIIDVIQFGIQYYPGLVIS